MLGLILSEADKKQYEQLEKEIDDLLKSGEYDKQIEKIFGTEMLNKIKSEGIDFLEDLTREEKSKFLTEFKSFTNKNDYNNSKDKMQIYLSSSIDFSDKFYEIKGNMLIIAENIILNESITLKNGKTYSFKDISFSDTWQEIPLAQQKEIVQEFNNLFFAKTNKYLAQTSKEEGVDLAINKNYGLNMSFGKMQEGVAGEYNGGKPKINTDFFVLDTIKNYDKTWDEQYSPFLNLTTTVLHEGFFGHGFSTMLKDKSGKLNKSNFAIDVQILKSNYGEPMSLQEKYLFYQLEPDEASAFWSENLPEHIIQKLERNK